MQLGKTAFCCKPLPNDTAELQGNVIPELVLMLYDTPFASSSTGIQQSRVTPSALVMLQGLRTLVLGTKVLSEEVWADWDSRYQDAAAQLDNREEALAALAVEIEADLEFVGVTAIEDKLQEGVPAAIQSLLDAGMKVGLRWQPERSPYIQLTCMRQCGCGLMKCQICNMLLIRLQQHLAM